MSIAPGRKALPPVASFNQVATSFVIGLTEFQYIVD